MKIYMVSKASKDLVCFTEAKGEAVKQSDVSISYDNRHQSPEFTLEVAKIIGNHSIKLLFVKRTSSDSNIIFTVRYLNGYFGVMITASINRKNITE